MSRKLAFTGIDVAFAKSKKLPVCVVTWEDNRLTPLPLRENQTTPVPTGKGNPALLNPDIVSQFAQEVLKHLQAIERDYNLDIAAVAIDAPRAYKVAERRACERAMDRLGISCFATPSQEEFEQIKIKAKIHLAEGKPVPRLPHANQLWMLAGFEIFSALEAHYNCLEVFPQATAYALGANKVHKTKKDGLANQLAQMAAYTGWQPAALQQTLAQSVQGALHDQLDAYMCAWVASLYPDECLPCGDPPLDVIWIPKIDKPVTIKPSSNEAIAPPTLPIPSRNKPPEPRVKPQDNNPSGEFRSGSGPTTQIGYINRRGQECLGTRGVTGNDHNAVAYKILCHQPDCGQVYGANGTDIHIRKCPRCQDGAAGIPY